ncbi:MAG: nuclear transport factor 2 family protein [Panacibacter sp.]
MKAFLIVSTLLIFNAFCFQTFAREKTHKNKVKMDEDGYDLKFDSTEAAEVTRLSKLWMEAMLRHDSTTLNQLMAVDYKLKKGDGMVVAERPDWLNNLYNNLKITSFEQTDISAQVYGDVGVVTSLYSWAGSFHDHAFDSKGYLTDVWVRRNGHWQVISRTSGTFEGSNGLRGK